MDLEFDQGLKEEDEDEFFIKNYDDDSLIFDNFSEVI